MAIASEGSSLDFGEGEGGARSSCKVYPQVNHRSVVISDMHLVSARMTIQIASTSSLSDLITIADQRDARPGWPSQKKADSEGLCGRL